MQVYAYLLRKNLSRNLPEKEVIAMIYGQYAVYAGMIAREAGQMIKKKQNGGFSIENKHSKHDFVTNIDKESESFIRSKLGEAYPSIQFVGEEQERNEQELSYYLEHMSEDEYCWIVDPLDGTINFLKGLPGYAVSIGLKHYNRIVAGAIYVPDTDELFHASLGGGAMCNGSSIYVSRTKNLDDAFLTTSIPVEDNRRRLAVTQIGNIANSCMNIRMIGATARAIAYTACGIFDGYWDIGPHPWDVAAGILLLKEAGGMVTNDKGDAYSAFDERIVATNGKLQASLIEKL